MLPINWNCSAPRQHHESASAFNMEALIVVVQISFIFKHNLALCAEKNKII